MARSIGTMVRLSLPGLGRQFCLAGSVIAVACLPGGIAAAQGKLDARYTATLTGVPIGKGNWVIEIAEDQYTAAASGMTTGLLRVFANGNGSGASRGLVRGDSLIPTTYASRIDNDKRVEELRIVLSAGAVKEVSVDPPSPPNTDRTPLADAHRRGVADPMSARLLRVAGSGDPVSPEACRRTIAVFDGRMRFDLTMSFKRIEKVQAAKGYQGPVAVCGVQFVPLAGFWAVWSATTYPRGQRR